MNTFTTTIGLICVIGALLTACLAGCAGTAGDAGVSTDRTVLLTRHAEKEGPSADPSLSFAGAARSIALSELPETQGVRSIITTQYRRTVETAQPLAEKLGILSRTINATGRADALADLAAQILDSAQHGPVLVVGHSNTVPLIIRQLGGPGDIQLAEEDFGDLFILTIRNDGTVLFERKRYGD